MKVEYHILIVAAVMLLSSCGIRRAVVQSQRADSVRIVRQVEIVERVRDTTIYVPVPAESRETVRQDSSHLETTVALSDAVIRADGSRFHSLTNKPVELPAFVPLKETELRTEIDTAGVRIERMEVPVRMPLSWWGKFWNISGKAAWGIVCIMALVWIEKRRLK